MPVSPFRPKAKPAAYCGSSSSVTRWSPNLRGGSGAPNLCQWNGNASRVQARCLGVDGAGGVVADPSPADDLLRYDRSGSECRAPSAWRLHWRIWPSTRACAWRRRRPPEVAAIRSRPHRWSPRGRGNPARAGQVERGLHPVEAGLHVGLPRRSEIPPSSSWSSRPIGGVAPAFSTRMSGRTSASMRWAAPSSRDVGGRHGDAEPVLDACERVLVARHDGHLGPLAHQGPRRDRGPSLCCRRSLRSSPCPTEGLISVLPMSRVAEVNRPPESPRTFEDAEKSQRGPRALSSSKSRAFLHHSQKRRHSRGHKTLSRQQIGLRRLRAQGAALPEHSRPQNPAGSA